LDCIVNLNESKVNEEEVVFLVLLMSGIQWVKSVVVEAAEVVLGTVVSDQVVYQ